MSGFDWPALMRVGLCDLRLSPDVFWRLTPLELKLMLGADGAAPGLSRARLDELVAAFPDGRKAKADDEYRRPDRTDHCP